MASIPIKMHKINLREVVTKEHHECVSKIRHQCSQDVKIICFDGEIWCSKILMYVMEPSLKTVLLEEGDSECVIIYLSKYVGDFLYFFDDESANPKIESSSRETLNFSEDADMEDITNSEQCSDTFSCEICGLVYKSLKQLKSHRRSKHKEGEDQFECSECKKKFMHRYELNKHMFIHMEASFVCEFCEQKFKRRKALVQHYDRIHKQTFRPLLECPECPASFSQQCHLSRHMNSHRDVKYNCSYCNATYGRLDNLQRHVKTKHSLK